MIFVDAYSPLQLGLFGKPKSVAEIKQILTDYTGPAEAALLIDTFIDKNNLTASSMSDEWLFKLSGEAEIRLSGMLGPSISSLIFRNRTILTADDKAEISDSVRKISSSLRLSRQELSEKNRQLALLKDFSENIIESVPLGIAMLDGSLHVKYWNDAMEKIIGVSRDDALNIQADLLLTCLGPDLFNPKIKEGESICKRDPGNEPQIVLKVHLSKLTGNQKGFVLVMEDITEKKKIEEELFRTTKHASIGRLAAGVSHEIGNPLASISSLVQELMSESLSPFVSESLGTINTHIDRIVRIVRNLGDFARLYPRQKIHANLRDILENTLNLIRYDKNFKKIDIGINIDDMPPMKIDSDQMQQVFLNFMLNARDAMPDGGKLSITIRQRSGFAEIIFADTGKGIDYQNIDKIFDPFFSTKGPAKGTGLGLSICYSIIKDHGGRIDVEPAESSGTRFMIKIPLAV